VFTDVYVCRSSLLSGTSAFADDPWAVIEDRGNAVSDDRSMTVDQIRQQQQQIIARLYLCSLIQSKVLYRATWLTGQC